MIEKNLDQEHIKKGASIHPEKTEEIVPDFPGKMIAFPVLKTRMDLYHNLFLTSGHDRETSEFNPKQAGLFRIWQGRRGWIPPPPPCLTFLSEVQWP